MNNEEKHALKLRIQKELMDRHQEIKDTSDIGYTSWNIASNIVDNYPQFAKRKPKKFLDFLKAKL